MAAGADAALAAVVAVLAGTRGRAAASITPALSLDDDLGCDELDRIEAVMTLESNLRIEISDAEMADVRTVGDLAALVRARRGAS